MTFGSISDECSAHRKVSHKVKKDSVVDFTAGQCNVYMVDKIVSLNEEETKNAIVTVGKRFFWKCKDLSGPITSFISVEPMRERHVDDFVILQCDSMQQMPYRCKGCCFMLFDGLIWNFCVVTSFTKEHLQYKKFGEKSLTLDKIVHYLDLSSLMKGYVFKFVNVFHCNQKMLEKYFLHHCVINKHGNVEGMLKPSILKEGAHRAEYLSRKEIRMEKNKKKVSVKHGLCDESNVKILKHRGKRCQSILDRTDD